MHQRRSHTAGSAITPSPRSSVPLTEPLESRVLLAATPAGPVFQANATTRGSQSVPAVAADADGDFVVVWRGTYQDTTAGGIYARRFDRNGAPRGGDFRVNAVTDTGGLDPAVAMDADGDFVVAWATVGPGGNGPHAVYVRRYDAAGAARGGPAPVSADAAVRQTRPSVAADDEGDFVVAWQSYDPRAGSGIVARRFDAAGGPRGDAFKVSTTFPSGQQDPSVGMDADGDFAVAWQSYAFGSEADVNTLRARRYRADGTPSGDEFQVDVDPEPQPTRPVVAMDADGDFAVVWQAYGAFFIDIRGRRFGSAPGTAGEEFVASTPGGGEDIHPGAAMDDEGDLVVTWSRGSDIPGSVYARRYPAAGAPEAAVVVNTDTDPESDNSSVAADADGDFVVAWESYSNENQNISARRFTASGPPPAARVAARHVFYNHSALDGGDASANAQDDAAIATDKVALLPGQSPSFANVTSFSHGLNGIMVDIANLPAGGVLSPDDFDIGGDGTRVVGVAVRRGAGTGGSDRVTLIWPDYDTPTKPPSIAVGNGWLRVTVKANADTGLASPDVFSFGNLIGETGDGSGATGWRVSALDLANVKRALNTDAAVTSTTDFDRNGRTNALDLAIVRRALNQALPLASAPPAAVPASAAGTSDAFAADDASPTKRVAEDVLA